MTPDANNRFSDDSLDGVIREAILVDTDQDRLTRLEHYWVIKSRRALWGQRAKRSIRIAAAALVAVATLVAVWNRHRDKEPAQAIRAPVPLRENSAIIELLVADDADVAPRSFSADRSVEHGPPITKNSLSEGRIPTAYECFVFAARTSARVPESSLTAAVDGLIGRMTLAPQSDSKQLLDSSGLTRSDAEKRLLQRLPHAANPQQLVILRLLADCGTQRSMPALLRLGRDDTMRENVLATIEQIVGIENLAQVVQTSTDPELRSALMRRLLTAKSEAALLGFLSLVVDEAVRWEALAVAEKAPGLPLDALVTQLDHNDQAVRIPAAMVLGQVNGPEVTQLLIARVTEKPKDSAEAWLALSACRGDLAVQFFAYAAHRPQLLGYFNGARLRWEQMIP